MAACPRTAPFQIQPSRTSHARLPGGRHQPEEPDSAAQGKQPEQVQQPRPRTQATTPRLRGWLCETRDSPGILDGRCRRRTWRSSSGPSRPSMPGTSTAIWRIAQRTSSFTRHSPPSAPCTRAPWESGGGSRTSRMWVPTSDSARTSGDDSPRPGARLPAGHRQRANKRFAGHGRNTDGERLRPRRGQDQASSNLHGSPRGSRSRGAERVAGQNPRPQTPGQQRN